MLPQRTCGDLFVTKAVDSGHVIPVERVRHGIGYLDLDRCDMKFCPGAAGVIVKCGQFTLRLGLQEGRVRPAKRRYRSVQREAPRLEWFEAAVGRTLATQLRNQRCAGCVSFYRYQGTKCTGSSSSGGVDTASMPMLQPGHCRDQPSR